MYSTEFVQVLVKKDLFGGDANHADLRHLYKGIIDLIIQVSVVENGKQYQVQLTEVDADFVRSRAREFLSKKEVAEKYSKDEILSTVCMNIPTINEYLLKDVKNLTEAYRSMGKEPVFLNPLASVSELRKRGLLN